MGRVLSLLSLTVVIIAGLSACASGDNPSVDLPLTENRPTFLFFYTDN